MKKNYSRTPPPRRKAISRYLPLFLVAGIFILLFLGTVISVWLTQRTQELRQQASVEAGLVRINLVTEPAELKEGVPSKVHFFVDTQQLQVDGVQLFFTVDMPSLPPANEVSLTIDEQTGLKLGASKIETVSGKLQVQFISISGETAQPFSSTGFVKFATLEFTPASQGQLKIEFDNTRSKSTVYQSDPVRDELATITTFTKTITAAQDATITPTNTPVAAQPTATPGGGGNIGKSCNESCQNNAECGVNLFCYQNNCRSPNNPTSTSCSGQADQGIARRCNEYCADSRECQTGLTCYYNRCRHPQNVTNQLCALPSATPSSGGTGGTTLTKAPSRTPTPRLTAQPTTTPSEYLQNLEANQQVNDVFNTGGTVVTVTPASQIAQVQPSVRPPIDTMSDESELDPNQKLIFLVGGVGGTLLLILLLPLFFAMLSKKQNQTKPINAGLEKLITRAPQPTPPAQPGDDIARFAGSAEARKPKEEEKPPTGLSSS